MTTCYFPIYNSATGEFEKHDVEITSFIGISGFCPLDSNHVILVSSFGTSSTDSNLNIISNNNIVYVNDEIENLIQDSILESEQDVDINTSITNDVIDMNVTIYIEIINPVVKAEYKPIQTTKKTDVVKKV